MCPPARSFGTNARQPWTTPIRLIETIHSQSSRVVSSKLAASPTPALLTSRSTLGTASAKARICSGSATSAWRATTSRPSARARRSVSARPSSSTSQIARSAPRCAHSSAVARPMPLPAPVTTTVRPWRSVVSIRGTLEAVLDRQPHADLQRAEIAVDDLDLPDPREAAQHRAVARLHGRLEMLDAELLRAAGELSQQRPPHAAALPAVDDGDGRLGDVPARLEPDEARDADALAGVGVQRAEGHVVVLVDFREERHLGLGEPHLDAHEALLARAFAELREARKEQPPVLAGDGTDDHRALHGSMLPV